LKKILILDDDKDLCWVLEMLFQDGSGNECTCVHSIQELKALGADLKFDLALLDVNLGDPEFTGLDAHAWLMKNEYKGKTVFFSGHATSDSSMQMVLKIPNTFFLEKPASAEKILALLK